MREINRLLNEILIIKKSLLALEKNSLSFGDWIPKNTVLKYFDYGENQLRNLEKTDSIVVSKIGRRKFYSLNSILKLIEKNKLQKSKV